MSLVLRLVICISALVWVAGCSSTAPTTMAGVYQFSASPSSEEEARRRSDCMADHSSFHRRQMMVSSAAVESAWVYCVRQSDVWYPGKEAEETQQDRW